MGSKGFYGSRLVAVLFVLDFVNMGFPYYGGSIINGYMLRDIAMSRSTLGLGFTVLNLCAGIAAIAVALSIIKYGIRVTFVIGSALICAGSLFLGFYASNAWHYVLGFGVINGVGISFAALVPAATAVTRWFRRYRGTMMGIALSASGIAGFAMCPLFDRMLRAGGGNWRLGWKIVAFAAAMSGLIALFGVKESPESIGQTVDGIPEEKQMEPSRTDALATRLPWTAAEAYTTSAYWLIAIGGIAAAYPYFLFIAHWVLRLRGAGITPADAAWGMSLLTIGMLVGRWQGGALMDFVNARVVFAIGLSIYLVGSYLAIIVRADTLGVAYLASLLHGVAYGWTFSSASTMIAHYYGPEAFPKLSGTYLLLTCAFASPAGYLGGRIFDLYGNYTRAFELDALLAALGIVAVAFAAMPQPRKAVASIGRRVWASSLAVEAPRKIASSRT